MPVPGQPNPLGLKSVQEKHPQGTTLIWRKGNFMVHMNHLLTWILLVLERLHPLLLAQRPLWPRLSSLVPHLSTQNFKSETQRLPGFRFSSARSVIRQCNMFTCDSTTFGLRNRKTSTGFIERFHGCILS